LVVPHPGIQAKPMDEYDWLAEASHLIVDPRSIDRGIAAPYFHHSLRNLVRTHSATWATVSSTVLWVVSSSAIGGSVWFALSTSQRLSWTMRSTNSVDPDARQCGRARSRSASALSSQTSAR